MSSADTEKLVRALAGKGAQGVQEAGGKEARKGMGSAEAGLVLETNRQNHERKDKMKLSASSRAYVAEQVRKDFGDELLAAEKRLEDAKRAKDAPYEALQKDLEKVSARWMEEFEKLMKRHGLRWADGKGPGAGAHVEAFDGGCSYDRVDEKSFAESGDETAVDEARDAVHAVKTRIEKAVQKALFEIEVRGRKSDLEQIVKNVIAEIKGELVDSGSSK